MVMTKDITIREITVQDAPVLAELHIEGIKTGFINSLGIDFITALYEALAESKYGFGFAAEEDEKILGFIALTTNLNKLYRSVILKRGLSFAFLLVGKLASLRRVKKIFQTLFYPSRVKKIALPPAELLSIVVIPQERQKGLAKRLLVESFAECTRRGIEQVKVMVWVDNMPANEMYPKCRFKLVGQIDSHGFKQNIYVAKIDQKDI